MRCPHCKAKNPDNAIYCCACDAWILEPVNREKNPPPRRDFWYQLRSKKRLLITISTAIALCILLLCVLPQLLPQLPTPAPVDPTPIVSDNYILCQQNIEPIEHNGKLSFISDDQLLKTDYTECSKFITSLDGRTAAALTDDQTLLYIREQKVIPIAADIIEFKLSTTGDGMVYLDNHGNLWHYHIQNKNNDIIYDATPGLLDYDITPDGKTVTFFRDATLSDSIASVLWIYRNQEAFPCRSYDGNRHNIISVSNNGEYIYTSDFTTLFCYSNQILTKVGQFTASLSNRLTYSNADHTQLLFYQNDGTYLSVNGQAATCISPENLEPVFPEMTQSVRLSDTHTEPIKDFSKSIFQDTVLPTVAQLPAYSLWTLDETDVCQQLVNRYIFSQLDPSGRLFYYLSDTHDLYQLDLNVTQQPQHIASNVTQFAITYDNSALFYATNDAIYVRNAAGENASLALIPSHPFLLVSGDNHLYMVDRFWTDNLSLTYLNDNGQFKIVEDPIKTYTKRASGLLYIDTYKALYLCIDGELKEILAYY